MTADRIVTLNTDPDMASSPAGAHWWPTAAAVAAAGAVPPRTAATARMDAARAARGKVDAASTPAARPTGRGPSKGWF